MIRIDRADHRAPGPAVAAGGSFDIVEVRDDATLAACVPVIRDAFREMLNRLGFTREQVPTNAAFLTLDQLRAARQSGARVFALRNAGRVIGSMSLRDGSRPGVLYLERLAVAPPLQCNGYGALLLDQSRVVAAAAGAVTVSAGIIDTNTELKRWYQRHGFVVTGTRVFEHLPFAVCYLATAVPNTKLNNLDSNILDPNNPDNPGLAAV